MNEAVYCERHPLTETNLRCGKCDTPICPRCIVHAPVGIRCPTCANIGRLPTFELKGWYMVRAVVAGLVLGFANGGLWMLLATNIPFIVWIALTGIGYLNGEGISVATNRKRGASLRVIAAASVLISYIVGVFLIGPVLGAEIFGWIALVIAIYVAMNRVK